MKNIAFYSPGPQHGKTTASRFLARRFGYQQISFADPIKAMITALLTETGYSQLVIKELLTKRKEEPIDALSKVTARELMQKLGTEWGRQHISENIWLDIVKEELLREFKFTLVRIYKPGTFFRKGGSIHLSDTDLWSWANWDRIVVNDGTLDEFYDKLASICQPTEVIDGAD